ncbi:MAG: hypothetical protein ACK5UT_02270 [Acidobacteriota bacterium]|jgi:hypothetical protein
MPDKIFCFRFIVWFLLCNASLAALYGVDWKKNTEEAFGEDEVKREAARKLGVRLLEQSVAAPPAAVQADLPGIMDLFRDPRDSFRQQASAILAFLAMFRPDGEQVLAPAVPLLLSLFEDGQPGVQENAVLSVALLKPRPPVAAIGALHSVLKRSGGDVRLGRQLAAMGLARLSSTEPEAMRVLLEFLRSPRPARELELGLEGLRSATQDTILRAELLEAAGELVESSNDAVGLVAITVFQTQLGGRNRDARFREIAGRVLEQAARNENLSAARREAARETMIQLLRSR